MNGGNITSLDKNLTLYQGPSTGYIKRNGKARGFLGYEGLWSVRKVKELLRDLIKSKVIYQWNDRSKQ